MEEAELQTEMTASQQQKTKMESSLAALEEEVS